MAINSSQMRLSGLATGLDTDNMVKELMKVERAPVDKAKQSKQLLEWKREAYQDITNMLRSFKDDFFNVLKPSKNMLSTNNYKKFSANSTDATVVTAIGSESASSGTRTVKVQQLATQAIRYSDTLSSDLVGSTAMTSGAGSDIVNSSGKKIKVTLDGITREITLGTYTDTTTQEDFKTSLQSLINTAFGSASQKITVSLHATTNAIKLQNTNGATKITISAGSSDNGLSYLKFTSEQSNRISVSNTLSSIANATNGLTFDGTGKVSVKINDQAFTFTSSTSLSSMIAEINANSTAGVLVSYDETTDQLSLKAKSYGAGQSVSVSNGGSGTFFNIASTTEGKDSIAIIDGQTVRRPGNSFSVNGVNYSLLKESETTQSLTLSLDSEFVYNNIKSAVEKYNEIMDKLNTKLTEKYDRNFSPLTEEQKDAMSEEDIKKWEEKAKTGLLRNDALLQAVVTEFRQSMSDTISGVSGNLTNIGLSTGAYSDRGKITIDDTKLKAVIASDPDKILSLLGQKSTSQPTYSRTLSLSQMQTRYNEQGFFQRISDIVEKNISTIRDTQGNKGILIMKAGIASDVSFFSNEMYKQISGWTTRISKLEDKLFDKENAYYKKFTALETAMSKMNSQSQWMSSQLGGGR